MELAGRESTTGVFHRNVGEIGPLRRRLYLKRSPSAIQRLFLLRLSGGRTLEEKGMESTNDEPMNQDGRIRHGRCAMGP